MGWREWVALPQLGIPWIKAKVDTGARSSSIQALGVERFRAEGRDRVRFRVHPLQRDASHTVQAEADLVDVRRVRSSNGRWEDRPTIITTVSMAGREWPVEITLARRESMGFRMLLGRTALKGRFLVDPGRSYLTGKKP